MTADLPCSRCTTPLRAGLRFCPTCGTQVVPPANPVAAPPPADVTLSVWSPPPAVTPVWQPPPGTTPGGGGRARRWVVVALVLVLLVGGGAGAWFLVGRDDTKDDDRKAGAPGGDGAPGGEAATVISLLEDPDDPWQLEADDVLPGGTVAYDGVEYFPDAVVLTVRDEDDERRVIAGIDPADGGILWQRTEDDPDTYYYSCWALVNRLACPDGSRVELVDVLTGEVAGTIESDARRVESVRQVGDRIYVGAARKGYYSYDARVVAVDATTLDEVWRSDLDASGGSEDGNGIEVLDGPDHIAVTSGFDVWQLDPADGTVTGTSYYHFDEEIYQDGDRVFTTEYGYDDDPGATTVTDYTGTRLLEASGSLWYTSDDGSHVVDGRIGVGETLYDLDSGAEVWSRGDLAGRSFSWSTGEHAVLAEDYDLEETDVLDNATGETITTLSGSFGSYSGTVTHDALVAIDTGHQDFDVIDLATGDDVWSGDLLGLGDDSDEYSDPSYSTGVTDDALVIASDLAVVGYTGFPRVPAPVQPIDLPATPDEPEPSDGGTDYLTDCGSEPEFTAVSSTSGDGNLVVVFEVTATCPGGQVLDSPSTDITVATSDGVTYASGVFDFSGSPVDVPDSEGVSPGSSGSPGDSAAQVPLSFPADTVFATAEEVAAAIADEVIRVDCVQDDAATSPSPGTTDPPSEPPAEGTAGAPGESVDTETALDALRRIANEDYEQVGDDLVGHWVPQLSSKKFGMNGADGRFTYADILEEHQQLRLTYPGVKLLFSSEWNFLTPGLWVTLTGLTYDTWRPALQYCYDQGFDKDHCYTKLLFRVGGPVDHTSWFLTDRNRIPRNGPPPLGSD